MEVQNWLKEVGRTKTQVQILEARVKEMSRLGHFTLRNSIDRLTTEVNQLIQRGVFHGGLTLQVCDSGVPMVTKELVGENFQKNKTAIWEKLMNDNIPSVGVCGMGGIGKTTLITHIHDQLLDHSSSSVAWVTVSQNCGTLKLQDKLAKVLGLGSLKENDERKRAAVLASILRKKKNFVLILDDIWDPIKLVEVGIPANEIGCKLVITTRSLHVCQMMDCMEIIKVEPLSENDAWELFQMHLGQNAMLPSEIEEIGKSLVKEFAGLPLGIILAAGCLRGVDDICQWNDALEEMKNPSLGQDELEFSEVFRVLKYSFDKLNPTLQQCFLYCALYPEDYPIHIEGLIQHFIDEKLIHGMNTRRAELNRGHTILNKLETSCLLERGSRFGDKYVKMHDVVRDMAIRIASMNSPRFLVGVEATDKLEDEKLMEDTVRMSLIISDFDQDRTPYASPRCASLSFYNLQCLTSLVLRDCFLLKYMSSLENLKALRRLDLCHSGIRELPQGIDTLTNLRYLDLMCPIKIIPDGSFCKLSHLQYLVLNHRESFPIRLEEIASLRKLETLRTSFRDLNDFNACVNSWKDGGPADYTLAVKKDCFFNEEMEYYYKTTGNGVYLYEDDANGSRGRVRSVMLPNHIKSLIIEKLDNVDVVTSFCDQRAFDLRKLVIKSCGGIKQLLPCSCFSVPAFQSLEFLYLEDLHSLSDLVEVRSASSALHTATFSCLTKIKIWRCHGIRRLFTPALVYNLQNLEYLEVGRCNQMVEIIEPFDELDCQQASSSISSTLPNLRHLHLSRLRELKIFCTNMHFPSLKDNIYIKECPQLKRFPPLPPLPSSKEAAGSTSTISLKAIVIDAKERAKDTEPPSTKEVAGSTSTISREGIVFYYGLCDGIEIDEKDWEEYTEERLKLKLCLPWPPPTKEVAGSTSTISLEGIEIDEKERAKWLSL
ncbi:hypothetical protein FNV43_RR21055 [Rhamnella rubrinervis]|uniref:NB-ARC domain-containing protein n=1 Tax=Rhamnella rubrinervis TaxID=2594499 RepID=A0A8K0DZZ5_9ROSA|nr:hypothetical protein FNV43_RR21055 [Rhamnella rubrinervis]